ncbi:MAG: hypothetical protein LBT86_08285 [Deltaproteobacteria bacterium]|nr:hypothetical protein [Deltaproteobacteria bacterium]
MGLVFGILALLAGWPDLNRDPLALLALMVLDTRVGLQGDWRVVTRYFLRFF